MPSLGVVLVDVGVVIGAALVIGASAPRWPATWLRRDVGPLRLTSWETSARYRAIGVTALARTLPELGATFGGSSKSRVPDMSAAGLAAYTIELRRAEWVHWLSALAALVLFAFNVWWLALTLVVVTAAVNAPFIAVLRHNRLRIRRITQRLEARHDR